MRNQKIPKTIIPTFLIVFSTASCIEATSDSSTEESEDQVALECKTIGAPCTESCLATDDTCATEAACADYYDTCVAEENIQEMLATCSLEYDACLSETPEDTTACEGLRDDCELLAVAPCDKNPDDCSDYCESIVVDYCQIATTVDSSKTRTCLDALGDCYETNDDTDDAEARYTCNLDAVDCFAIIMEALDPTCVAPLC